MPPTSEGGEAQPALDESAVAAAQACLEEILSKKNLAEDPNVQQNLNPQMFVPMYALAGHPKVLQLGSKTSMDILLAASRRSEKLQVDEDNMMVRPLIKQRRDTIILRDLPQDVTEEELKQLFQPSKQFEKLVGIKPDVNHTAYITFDSDEAAQDVALWLRSQKLRGEQVKCAMKSDHFMRSFFPAQPGMAAAQGSWPASPWTGPSSWGTSPHMGPHDSPGMWSHGGWELDQQKGCKGGCKGFGKGKQKGKTDGIEDHEAETQRLLEQAIAQQQGTAHEPEAEVGYKHEFRRYTKQQIVEICSAIESVPKPASFTSFEKDNMETGLFRNTALKDWAPPPTPMMSFAANMLDGNAGRAAAHSGADEGEHTADESQHQQRRRSRGGGGGKGSGAWSEKPKRKDSKHEEAGSGDWNDWEWPATGGAGWAPEAAETSAKGQSRRKPSWVEKKPQPQSKDKEKDKGKQKEKEKEKEEKEEKEKEKEATKETEQPPQEPKKPSWADRVKNSSPSKPKQGAPHPNGK
mmetsp:Transcript_33199/g.50159  ORF Transcript_33199/g.50159 Transcript_33199/m.50159 type:complete len:520 (+) Transcript_33199:275-1834(+)|eukprot:CAMPEP_0194759500 /NCGR_PEP_ID=MMETSP0323_2-20130528/12547_1 /TAXON_ID=2866 ORGANISM="Crypthecodinium cohnii, Strain Seligo" /NCGR_SAMPLE_ID=MMETSP0323_2 /ASSEMBLY_ACC=CAM_ASM_000346 /LENGTH=519 /DNA_ID=CAMNT_0039680267 /DNA_START=183 /DNA_END=1742 /DNA_ORIENTATION=+